MPLTPLELSATSVAASTLPQAAQLTPTGGTPTTTTAATTLGTATGYGEITGLGTTAAWGALDGLGDPTGLGLLWDVTTLEAQQIAAGTWTPALSLACTGSGGAPTVTADLYVRAYVCNSTAAGSYVAIGGPILLAGVTLTAAAQSFALPATALPAAFLGTGDKLYLDVWADVTANNAGSSSATIVLSGLGTTLGNGASGTNANTFTTPGYTAQTPAQLSTAYSYGAFQLHDLVSFYVVGKTFALPAYKQALYKMARLPGMKKSGETVDAVTIPLQVRILATSRADLEGKIDALLQVLALRQQRLTLHARDSRYWVCDCVKADVPLPPGAVISAVASLSFVAQNPYAYGPSRSFVSGPAALSLVSGTSWQISPNVTITGQGNAPAYPTITIANNTRQNHNTLGAALTSGSNYTTLTIASPGLVAAATAGQVFQLDDGAGHTQPVTVATGGAASGATSLPVNSFQANFSYPATTTSVYLATGITQVALTQTLDGLSITVASISGLSAGNSLVLTCDPTVLNGWTVLLNGAGSPLSFSGVFPVQEPQPTGWALQVVCVNQPTVTATWTWQPRYLS